MMGAYNRTRPPFLKYRFFARCPLQRAPFFVDAEKPVRYMAMKQTRHLDNSGTVRLVTHKSSTHFVQSKRLYDLSYTRQAAADGLVDSGPSYGARSRNGTPRAASGGTDAPQRASAPSAATAVTSGASGAGRLASGTGCAGTGRAGRPGSSTGSGGARASRAGRSSCGTAVLQRYLAFGLASRCRLRLGIGGRLQLEYIAEHDRTFIFPYVDSPAAPRRHGYQHPLQPRIHPCRILCGHATACTSA